MCGQREPKWKDKKLSCKLSGMPPDSWFNETGVGEIVLCSRGFFKVGSTSVVPSSIINYVKAYLREHHSAMIEEIKKSVGVNDVLPDLFSENEDFIIFHDPDTDEYRIMSRSQARIIHQLQDQMKFAKLAKERLNNIKAGIYSRREPAQKYMHAWNRYYLAKGVMEIGNRIGLLDKRDNVILESVIDANIVNREISKLRTKAYIRRNSLDV